jgi:type I restriction enzyme, S subunit
MPTSSTSKALRNSKPYWPEAEMMAQTDSKVPQIRFKGFEGEWEEKALGDLFPITSAARVHKNEWTKSGVRFFRSSDVVSLFKGNDNIKAYISHELYEELSAKVGRIEKGDMLVTGGGSIGIPYLVETDEPLYFKDADLLWFKIREKVNSHYLYTSLSSDPFRRHLKSISHIGTIAHYTVEQAKGTPLRHPKNSDEQTQIGTFFRELDSLIGLHQRKHDKLVTLKNAMLQKMFPQPGATTPEIRFKGFSKPWEEKTLGNEAIITMGQSPSGANYTNNPADFVLVQGNADMKNGYVTPRVWTTQVTKTANAGDLILSVRAPVGEVGKTEYDVVLGRGVAGIKGNEFIFQSLSRMNELGYWIQFSSGSTFDSINSEYLREAILVIPCKDEQQKLGTYFRKLDELISKHAIQLQKLKQIKSACLEKMFV